MDNKMLIVFQQSNIWLAEFYTLFFSSSLSLWGTHIAHTWFVPNANLIIWWTLSKTHLNCQDNSLNNTLLSSSNKCSVLSVFTFVTAVCGLPLRELSTTILFPSLKCFHHQDTVARLITFVLNTFCNISSPLFQASHETLWHVSAMKHLKYSAVPPMENRVFTKAP